jgi:uncharacterized SAM-binding protein YcdF (DUF218 family)
VLSDLSGQPLRAASLLGWLLLVATVALRRRFVVAVALLFLPPLALAILALSPVSAALERWAEASARSTWRPDERYDAVIVLTGDDAPRIARAAQLLREGQARHLLLSGAPSAAAERLRSDVRSGAVPGDRIVHEDLSRNTHENAVESARVVAARGWRSLLLVTSAAHMPRALGSFRKAGLRPDALPVDFRAERGLDRPWLSRAALDESAAAVHELVGRIAYRVRGYSGRGRRAGRPARAAGRRLPSGRRSTDAGST